MKDIIDKILEEPEFSVTYVANHRYQKFISVDQACALAERCMAEQREIDAKICETLIINQRKAIDGNWCADAIRSQKHDSDGKP